MYENLEYNSHLLSNREKKNLLYLKKLHEKKKKRKKNKKLKNDIEKKDNLTSNDTYSQILKNFNIEYVEQEPELSKNDEMKKVIDSFNKNIENKLSKEIELKENEEIQNNENNINEKTNNNNNNKPLNKKQLKQLSRIKLPDLKQIAKYPEVVEIWDVTSIDPKLLVYFKCLKNTIPVPNHWAQKNQYLQSKRGINKSLLKLPDYIEATGISQIRKTDDDIHKSLKQRVRERMSPKLGRLDLDYQVLHDAFFKYQTKPKLTRYGEIYYENKDLEDKMKKFQPGRITSNLRTALGISKTAIPTFVINMQRFGIPPSYPNLHIPGVNEPLNDPTARITPKLWEEPDEDDKQELIWNYANDENEGHWGVLKEGDDEIYSEEDDMGNDQDDLEISDEEMPDVKEIFSKKENENGNEQKENKKYEIKDKEENKENKENEKKKELFTEIKKKEVEIGENELNPLGYRYEIETNKNKEENKDNKNDEIEKEKNNKNNENEENEEEDEEEINKKIF
jgi:splicing factor 3B subunit 2